MQQPSRLRLTGRVKTLFDPRKVVVSEEVGKTGVVVRFELPEDDVFWAEVSLSEEWLAERLAALRGEREEAAARNTAAAAMPAWTPGRELA
jgi:hypothetical protein